MSGSGNKPQRGWKSWILPILFAVLGVLAMTGAAIGSWAHSVLLDTETWTEVMGPVATDEGVRDAVADAITDQINALLRPTERLQNRLPDALNSFAAVLGAGIEGIVEEEVTEFVYSERYENVWLTLNENAHQAVVAAIRNELPFLSTEGGVVSVDLRPYLEPVLDTVILRLQGIGEWLPEDVLDVTDVDDALRELIVGYQTEGLPESLGEVVIYESETLGAVQDYVELFDRLVFVLPIVALAFAAVAIWLAPSKAGMVILLSAGGILSWLGTMLATDQILAAIVEGLATSTSREVAAALLTSITQALYDLLRILILIAAVTGALGIGVVVMARRDDGLEVAP